MILSCAGNNATAEELKEEPSGEILSKRYVCVPMCVCVSQLL